MKKEEHKSKKKYNLLNKAFFWSLNSSNLGDENRKSIFPEQPILENGNN
ncbi:hypothetical protein PP182_03655 [Maribacter sp. PR1]|uniref:Uncharacterized protein n=1 Tax=Maribacter cobaltidurans TaxID=1178778 RepID=A0ABU7IQI0_9FLAO|nr:MULTISPECIES: hypothetical protein [Maribacter]MDC6387761.1 hypothetical protein [Maribacter sp. PR1]MEE1975150.1 hypothetical protein [Maribacter cobaltidurans]